MPTSDQSCFPLALDYGFVSDYSSDWMIDNSPSLFLDYCVVSDQLKPIRMDTTVLRDFTIDLGNAELELVEDTSSTDTDIVVRLTDGRLYNPVEHIVLGTTPKILPKGFVKFKDEIISYTGMEYYDYHDGSFSNKKYLLTGCSRGVNGTTAADYRINLYYGYEYLLNGNRISIVYEDPIIVCSVAITPSNILTHANHGLSTNDIVIFTTPNPSGGILGDTYYYIYQLTGDTFQISTTPITGPVTPVTITSATGVICKKIHFRLATHRDPNTFNVENVTRTILSYSTTYDCTLDEINSRVDYIAHGLSNGDIIQFRKGVGNIDPYVNYYVANAHTDYFQIKDTLAAPSAITFVGITDISNTYFVSGTRVIATVGDYIYIVQIGYNYRFLISDILSTYNYCSQTHTYGIDFETGTDPVPDITLTTLSYSTTYDCILDETNSRVNYIAHGLINGDIVYFRKGVGNIDPWRNYYVTNAHTDYFQIKDTLAAPSAITFVNIKDTSNTYLKSGTRVIATEEGYQHRYSLIQHILWRLDNEVAGNDLQLVYGMTTSQLLSYKLNTYTGIGNGIIWPTPHFKYGFEINTTNVVAFPPDELVTLVLKKLKQYKPKHTVADLSISYPLGGIQATVAILPEYYETENLMSDAYRAFNGTTSLTTSQITSANHDLHEGEIIYIEGGDTAGLVFGTLYYVKYVDTNTFQVSLSSGGVAITLTANTNISITQSPVSEYRITLSHDPAHGVVDYVYDLPLLTMDTVTDYGASINFTYTWQTGTPQQQTITYIPFLAYPAGLIIDGFRNRKRYLGYVDS